jgi:phosphohistidine phosphatase SixA
VSSTRFATNGQATGTGENVELQNLKKEHRGLRRRPLYSPLAFIIASILGLALVAGWAVASWGSTTVVLVRHAERVPEGRDPELSEVGARHAQRLAELLEYSGIVAIYVSEARRTQQTAAPLAAATGVNPQVVPADSHKRLLRRLKWRHGGDVVLVVGHSNTVPRIADGLGAEIGVVEAEEYSGLWVISYSRLRGTRVLTLRY